MASRDGTALVRSIDPGHGHGVDLPLGLVAWSFHGVVLSLGLVVWSFGSGVDIVWLLDVIRLVDVDVLEIISCCVLNG